MFNNPVKLHIRFLELTKRYRYEILFFIVFCLSRAPYLGTEMFNTDVWKWKARIYDFGSGIFNLDFDKTLQKYHPGVTLMWVGTAGVKLQGLYCAVITCPNEAVDPVGVVFTLHFFQKLLVVITTGFTLTLVFYPLKKLFGEKYAFVSLWLVSFEPFFYALTRVIHLEALMTSFMLASFVWLYYFLENYANDKKTRRLVISAIFAGLAILTKSSAIFIIPFSVLSIFLYQRKNIKNTVKLSALWILGIMATYFILWPSMWVNPVGTLDYVFIKGVKEVGVEGGHGQIFLGKYTENPGPFYYFVVIAYKFSLFLVTGILFFAFFFKKITQHFDAEKTKRFVLLGIIFTIGYLIEISIPTKKLDRYILPSLASISLMAGFFYTWLIFIVIPQVAHKIFKRDTLKHAQTYISILAFSLFIFFIAQQSLSLTPDYFSYYNPMFGGLSKGIYTLEPKWIIGQHQIAHYFVDLMKTNKLGPFTQGQSFDNQKELSHKLTVAFPEKYYTQIWPFIRKIGGWATIEDLTPNARRTTYFVYPVWDDYSNQEKRFKLIYLDSIYLRSVKLYNVYQRYDL
ncbi:MAG: glycosyltransferase family 39 protein [Patescibacteria group bacterium]